MAKRCIVFFDGQNLYHGARDAWAPDRVLNLKTPYSWPSYDVEKLASELVSKVSDRELKQIRFYTGVPDWHRDAPWHEFWSNKLRFLGSRGVYVYRGRISKSGQEKGVDVSIAIDLLKLTYEKAYDVAILVTGDSDLGPAVKLAKAIAKTYASFPTFESAFPFELGKHDPRGVPGTTWIHIDKALYDACRDPKEYRGPKPTTPTSGSGPAFNPPRISS